jgi:hypothetical protein
MEYENIPLNLALGLAISSAASAAYGEMSDYERKQVADYAETITDKEVMGELIKQIGSRKGVYE